MSQKIIKVGNAPCSWGTLEFEGLAGERIDYGQMLDELVATGYTGTELGDWGFMPTDPATLAGELTRRKIVMLGAFVEVRLEDRADHAPGVERVLRTARLLAEVAAPEGPQPFVVLALKNGADPIRTQNAGRVGPELGLSEAAWQVLAEGANRIARAVRAETGLGTVFHHHCAGYVETPDEIARLLELTDPELLGLVFDTGHFAFGAGPGGCEQVLAGLERFAGRVWYVHFKDCQPGVAGQSRAEGWPYFKALEQGVFCELGQGCVDFPAVLAWLDRADYAGYIVVEQDVLPGMGAPKASAQRNRDYLASIGL
jgi:inosose dehydratase